MTRTDKIFITVTTALICSIPLVQFLKKRGDVHTIAVAIIEREFVKEKPRTLKMPAMSKFGGTTDALVNVPAHSRETVQVEGKREVIMIPVSESMTAKGSHLVIDYQIRADGKIKLIDFRPGPSHQGTKKAAS